MSSIRKFELVGVAQKERPAKLESVVLEYLNELRAGESLLIGLPRVLGPWEECTPIIIGTEHRDQFLVWLKESMTEILGPVYNLPALSAFFLCVIMDDRYDPRVDGSPADATPELAGVLASFTAFLNERDAKAA